MRWIRGWRWRRQFTADGRHLAGLDELYKLVRVAWLHADGMRHPLRPVCTELKEEGRVVVSRCLERASVSHEVELEEQLAHALHSYILRLG